MKKHFKSISEDNFENFLLVRRLMRSLFDETDEENQNQNRNTKRVNSTPSPQPYQQISSIYSPLMMPPPQFHPYPMQSPHFMPPFPGSPYHTIAPYPHDFGFLAARSPNLSTIQSVGSLERSQFEEVKKKLETSEENLKEKEND
jgi:hypothetical protein